MFTNQIIRHKDADSSILDRVIALKQSAWPYPKESQQAWIQANLKDNDLHVILMQDGNDVAYLNMCVVHCMINGEELQCCGIGNVCSAVKGLGYGNGLMNVTNDWLKLNNQIGLLFCHSHVERFYAKNGWLKLEKEVCNIFGLAPKVLTYIYNNQKPIHSIIYKDRLF